MASQAIARTGRPLSPLPLAAVVIDDHFWSPKRDVVRSRTLPQQEEQMRKGGQFEALKLAWKAGEPEPHIFWESDVAKWIEAASHCLATSPDPELEAAVDEAIELLDGAQQEDGYLNVYFTVVRPGDRFTDLRDGHELYCAGHLIEAGVAHYQATGKTSLLGIVRRYADLIATTFSPGGPCEGGYDGHPEIELALVKLYRATGERRYLELSHQLITNRGRQPFYFDIELERRGNEGYFAGFFPQRPEQVQRFREYNQSHKPVAIQDKAVGHSVRAVYMYSALTDLAAEYGDTELAKACDVLWENLTNKKLYITGGIGSNHSIEGFGPDYDLPNEDAYAETCAAIGLVQWAQRMANTRHDGRYIDVLERALYNGVLSGASADGTRYFYGNPLASSGNVHRQEWFGVACCPPNLARLLSELGRYAYSLGSNEALINLFIAGTARFTLDVGDITLRQITDYPRHGKTEIIVSTPQAAEFTLSVRIPSWSKPTVTLNGLPLDITGVRNGYLSLTRTWDDGDTVSLDLNLAPRRTWANPNIASTTGKVALAWGPLVYCLEGVDHNVPVRSITLPRSSELRAVADDRTGAVTLHAAATALSPSHDGELYPTSPPDAKPVALTAVPYFSWANRGQADMTVWIHETGLHT
ncbi:glycoside hydrolase family 127 protein [Arthrobacter rhizosphaerae]|uniref:glycoside hydrolase family 127 protein n=1 Tax=Arthrobacter rhizosphaerae TaxID=2855490 RepID=UPI001FF499C8|nr:beta-L-arabinofuranosidase domain-containing protein [Arthrobacter rhizosphaerae]